MYGCHSMLECCGLFSGVKLSIRCIVLLVAGVCSILPVISVIVIVNQTLQNIDVR